MFSPRVFVYIAVGLAAACSALPADSPRPITTITDAELDDTWFGFPFFSNFFAPIFRFFPTFDFGPKVVSDEDKFQVTIPVKDYKKEDLKVKVKSEQIFVQGTHESKEEEHGVFASQFFHAYSLPRNASVDDVSAELSSDGWLTVTAPISGAAGERAAAERVVPIAETGAPYAPPKEVSAAPGAPAADGGDDERREPTTPPTDRDSTDKDNSIPHGTDPALV